MEGKLKQIENQKEGRRKMSIERLNIIINNLKIAFCFNDKARQDLMYWINAIGRINKLTDSEKGYILYNLQRVNLI